MKKVTKIIRILIIGALIIASLLLIFTTMGFLGFRMFSVQSGSMEPAIRAGGVVFNIERDHYRVDDIITFQKDGTNVTHRIIELAPEEDEEISYITQGDANNSPDPNPVSQDQISGRVFFNLPYLGYFASFLKTPPGLIIFIIVPATVIVYEEIGNIRKEVVKIREKKKTKKGKKDD